MLEDIPGRACVLPVGGGVLLRATWGARMRTSGPLRQDSLGFLGEAWVGEGDQGFSN